MKLNIEVKISLPGGSRIILEPRMTTKIEKIIEKIVLGDDLETVTPFEKRKRKISRRKTKRYKRYIVRRAWTLEDENAVIDAKIQDVKPGKAMKICRKLSRILARTPAAILTRYYLLVKRERIPAKNDFQF